MSFAVRNKMYIQHFARGRSGVNVCCDRLTFVIETIKIVTFSCYTISTDLYKAPLTEADALQKEIHYEQRTKQYGGNT